MRSTNLVRERCYTVSSSTKSILARKLSRIAEGLVLLGVSWPGEVPSKVEELGPLDEAGC